MASWTGFGAVHGGPEAAVAHRLTGVRPCLHYGSSGLTMDGLGGGGGNGGAHGGGGLAQEGREQPRGGEGRATALDGGGGERGGREESR
jgi:hypothetical protein